MSLRNPSGIASVECMGLFDLFYDPIRIMLTSYCACSIMLIHFTEINTGFKPFNAPF